MRLDLLCCAVLAVSVLANPAFAINEKDVADCMRSSDAQVRVDGCTRLLSDKTVSDKNRAIVLNNRGNAWKDKGEFDIAIADFSEALKIDPSYAFAYNGRGVSAFRKGDYDRALADFNEVVRLDPGEAYGYNGRGLVFFTKGDYDRAIADFNEAIRINPSYVFAYNSRGQAWRDKGEFDRALADFNAAIRLEPQNPGNYNNRALVFRDKGDLDRALADNNEALRLNPRYARAYHNRGEIWRLKGDLNRALADQEQALRLEPRNYFAYVLRGDTFRYRGDYARSLADYEQALRLQPDAIPALVARGLTYEKMRDLNRARAEFEKALASPSARRSDAEKSALETAQARLAALKSGAVQPVIPVVPALAAATSVPTPKLSVPGALPGSAVQGRRIALIVGNSAYRNVAPLANPQNDADAVATSLRAIGFETVALSNNVTREKLMEALRAFAEKAEQADWAMIYYAGHGVEVNGVNYLIPIEAKLDTDRDVRFEAVPLDQVLAALEGAKKLKLVLLDACRNNPFASQMRTPRPPDTVASVNSTAGGSIGSRSIGRGLAEMKVAQATLVVYAAKHGQVALDGEGANSPFAIALVQRLATPNVDITKVFRLVRDDVMEATAGRQEPYTYGSLPGREDFFFVAK